MKSAAYFFGLVVLGWVGVGCDVQGGAAGSGHKGGVAVLDLEGVAKRLGRDEVILTDLKAASQSLGEKVSATQADLQKQFDEQRAAFGQSPTEDDQKKLAKLQQDLSAELQAKQQEAQAELNRKHAAYISRFQEEVRPVARELAAERGLEVILVKSEAGVFSADPEVDITDAVVAKMISPNHAPAAPAAPAAAAPSTAPAVASEVGTK